MKVLVIGDCHEPVSHPGYLAFCQDLYADWDCDQVVFMKLNLPPPSAPRLKHSALPTWP